MEKEIKVNATDGALTKGLKISLNNTVLKLKGGWKQSVFARCFPSLATTHYEASLETIRNKAVNHFTTAILHDLSDVIEEELVNPLNRMSSLNKNNNNSQDYIAWRPSGSPEQDIRSHDAKVLHCQKQNLEQLVATHKKRRLQLFENVKNGRNNCEHNNVEINKVLQSLQTIQSVSNCASTKMQLYLEIIDEEYEDVPLKKERDHSYKIT